jgi:hypothetical protein
VIGLAAFERSRILRRIYRLLDGFTDGATAMESSESTRLMGLEQRLLRRLGGGRSPAGSRSDGHPLRSRLRSDDAVRHAEQLRHCLRWLRQEPTT